MAELKFELPLSDGQLHAIGHMVAQWALLEAMIDLLVLEPKTNPNPTVDSVPLAMSFIQRLRLWRLASQRLSGPQLEHMRGLINRAARVFERYETIMRGRWGLQEWVAEQVRVTQDEKTEKKAAEHLIASVAEAERVAEEISSINQELLGLCCELSDRLFPGAGGVQLLPGWSL